MLEPPGLEYPPPMFWIKNKYKRTNGPVNAHLRSWIYTNKQNLTVKYITIMYT